MVLCVWDSRDRLCGGSGDIQSIPPGTILAGIVKLST